MTTKTWTASEVRALPVRIPLVLACEIVLGVGKNKAWELYHSGQLPFPAIKVGRKVICATQPLLKLLDLTDPEAA